MSADLHAILRCGGKDLLNFLDYCARSIEMDAIFVFLTQEYRALPTEEKAWAIYEMFCAPAAPARISAQHALPPADARIQVALRPIQERRELLSKLQGPTAELIPPPFLPAAHLFDFLVSHLDAGEGSWAYRVSRHYDPLRSPLENLSGGRMTPAQRAFVEKVWVARVRPRLVSAGFRRIANVA